MGVTTFSILLIRSATPQTQDIRRAVLQAMGETLNIREVKLNEFQTYTRTKPIPRYILVAKESARHELEVSKERLSKGIKYEKATDFKGKFTVLPTGEVDTFDSARMTDPSYAVLDVHGTPIGTVVTLKTNPALPLASHRILQRIAMIISKWYTCNVIAVERTKSSYMEHASQFANGSTVFNNTAQYGEKLLTEFLHQTKIDINEILAAMDDNIDVLMAPQDLEDYRQIQEKQIASQLFLESMGLPDKNEDLRLKKDYADLIREITITKENLDVVAARITKDPQVFPIYIKFMQPEQLATYAVTDLVSSTVEKLNG